MNFSIFMFILSAWNICKLDIRILLNEMLFIKISEAKSIDKL